jgi:hypothetical protein
VRSEGKNGNDKNNSTKTKNLEKDEEGERATTHKQTNKQGKKTNATHTRPCRGQSALCVRSSCSSSCRRSMTGGRRRTCRARYESQKSVSQDRSGC